jgi:hypothetical protein
MTTIIGIAGKKQSGKNTSANFFHGKMLKEIGAVKDFTLNKSGQLLVETSVSTGQVGWGEFDIGRKDVAFTDYAEENMWPYVKLYSFADALKWMCVELFDIPNECLYGTDEQKNQLQEHLLWENMPGVYVDKLDFENGNTDPSELGFVHHSAGKMTAREFMQYFGTNVMRKILPDIWVQNTIKRINRERSKLAIIADVRFPNEVNAILANGGYVIKLNRNSNIDSHESEKAIDPENFDQSKFSLIIDNTGDISKLCNSLNLFYQSIVI